MAGAHQVERPATQPLGEFLVARARTEARSIVAAGRGVRAGRVVAERGQVAQNPEPVDAATLLDVTQHRVQRNRIAMDIGKDGQPHRLGLLPTAYVMSYVIWPGVDRGARSARTWPRACRS